MPCPQPSFFGDDLDDSLTLKRSLGEKYALFSRICRDDSFVVILFLLF